MGKEYIASAKTIEEAIAIGLRELDCSREDVSIEILEQPVKGILGFIGQKNAQVKLTMTKDLEDEILYGKPKKQPVKKSEPKINKEHPAPKKVKEAKPAEPEKAQTVKEQPVKEQASRDHSEDEKAIELIKSYIGEMTAKMHIAATVDATVSDNRLLVNLSGDDMGIIIGRRGETLDALQHLAQLYINKECDQYYRVVADTEKYREKREEALKNLAQGLAKKVMRTRKEIALEPMKAYERRIIHTALQGYSRIVTHSVGTEPNRRLVVGYRYPQNKDSKEE